MIWSKAEKLEQYRVIRSKFKFYVVRYEARRWRYQSSQPPYTSGTLPFGRTFSNSVLEDISGPCLLLPHSAVVLFFFNILALWFCIVLFFVNLDFHDFLLYSFLIQSLTCTPPSPNLLLHHILNYTQYEIPFFLSLDPPKTKILSLMSENPFPGLRVCVCPDTKIEAFLSKQRGAIDG